MNDARRAQVRAFFQATGDIPDEQYDTGIEYGPLFQYMLRQCEEREERDDSDNDREEFFESCDD